MKKIVFCILWEVWMVVSYFILEDNTWILRVPLGEILFVGFALVPVFVILIGVALNIKYEVKTRAVCIVVAMIIFFVFVIASSIELNGFEFDESIFDTYK